MLDFSVSQIKAAYGAFVGSFDEDENPIKVNETPLKLNEVTESLLITKTMKTFGQTEKWFTINHERHENALLIEDSITHIAFNQDAGKAIKNLAERLNFVMGNLFPANMNRPGEFLTIIFNDVLYFGAHTTAVLLVKVNNREIHLNITSNPLGLTDAPIIPAKFQLAGLFVDAGGEFKVTSIDSITKRGTRSSWNDDFLCITPDKDDYYFTEQWINLISNFAQKAGAALGYNSADKADFKRRSYLYFKDAQQFDQIIFEELLLKSKNEQEKFRDYVAKYQLDNNIELKEDFEIIPAALKANALLLKGRIILDSNFKIDIDGRRDLIENGFDEEKGQKYIKLYYDNEAAN